ncbi:hypothetical protein CROQUDRAFT_713848 [Cronartium quercuum f. sp. fusiforme G11]|uniref:Lipoprotein n=1 Tax=Cronartium quercuum f. sp. fusiforme G11 TaxID=708437 RepID=A0A9P6TFB2_9BASI|nr:hypothetical protein CROQUDRAFT_713848 [Cronartium quercuum f. sp. fusiforme G11]
MKHFSALIIFTFLLYAHCGSSHPSNSHPLPGLDRRDTPDLSKKSHSKEPPWLQVETNCTKRYYELPFSIKVRDAVEATKKLLVDDTVEAQCGTAVASFTRYGRLSHPSKKISERELISRMIADLVVDCKVKFDAKHPLPSEYANFHRHVWDEHQVGFDAPINVTSGCVLYNKTEAHRLGL